MGTVAPCKGIRIPECGKILFEESGIQLKESEIPLTIGIQNPESRIPVPLTANTQILESTTWTTESTAWNQDSKTVLDQTSTQSLLCMRYDLWERFSQFAVHQGKDGRKTRSFCHFSSLLPKRVKCPFHIPLRE